MIELSDFPDTPLEQIIWVYVKRSFDNTYREPLSELLDEIPSHVDSLERSIDEATTKLAVAQSTSKDEWAEFCFAEHEKSRQYIEQVNWDSLQKRKRLEVKLHEIEAWDPPTKGHGWIKQRIIEDVKRYLHDPIPLPTLHEDLEGYRQKVIQKCERQIVEWTNNIKERKAKAAEELEWLRKLKDAIGDPPTRK